MQKIILTALILFVAAGCSTSSKKSPQFKTAREMPVEAFFQNPVLYGYRVSPDGKTMALLKPWKSRLNIFVHPAGKPKDLKQVTFIEERDIDGIHWKGNDHVLYTRDTGGDENTHVYSTNVRTGETKDLTPYPKVRADIEDDLEELSPTDILVTHNQRDPEYFDLYRLNVATGDAKLIGKNDKKYEQWLTDHTGEVRGGVQSDGVNKAVFVSPAPGKPVKKIFTSNFRTSFAPIAFTSDNKNLFVLTNHGSDVVRVVEIDPSLPSSRFIVRAIASNTRYDLNGGAYSEVRKSLSRYSVTTDRGEIHWLHPEDRTDWQTLGANFPGRILRLANHSRDERQWVVKTDGDTTDGEYFLYDRNTKQATSLGAVGTSINPELMSEMKTVEYQARDGL
ncbi:MAG TPA: hypothetical protein PKC28_15725, partial [Bdellovibrionales bacterium]|nr:hypothetical protein [Bdellovibrionales bacterium]